MQQESKEPCLKWAQGKHGHDPTSKQRTSMFASRQGSTRKTAGRAYVPPARTAVSRTVRDDWWRHVEMRNPGTVLVGMRPVQPLRKTERRLLRKLGTGLTHAPAPGTQPEH